MSDFLGDVVEIGTLGLVDGGDITGENQANASRDAAATQAAAEQQRIDLTRETRDLARADLQPFVEFGTNQIGSLSSLLTPEGQVGFLENNPMFNAAINRNEDKINKFAAARGKSGAGGTIDSLFQNYLSTAQSFIQPQIANLFGAVNQGQASAAGQANTALSAGNQIGQSISQIGDVNAAGIVGAANAGTNAFNQLLNVGGNVAGAVLGGGF